MNFVYLDINSFDQLNKSYIEKEIQDIKVNPMYNNTEKKQKINEVQSEGFYGNIPAFKRMVIIYEKKNQIDNAIEICKVALKYYKNEDVSSNYFKEKLEKLQSKKYL